VIKEDLVLLSGLDALSRDGARYAGLSLATFCDLPSAVFASLRLSGIKDSIEIL
jgi:hypothetical protein